MTTYTEFKWTREDMLDQCMRIVRSRARMAFPNDPSEQRSFYEEVMTLISKEVGALTLPPASSVS
jgi:hypothetical protein